MFGAEERIRQTIYTVSCLRNIFPDAKIYILDASLEDYSQAFSFYNDLTYVHIFAHAPGMYDSLTNHINKSYSEALILDWFVTSYRDIILNYDYLIKVSGRYFFENVDAAVFDSDNLHKFFFKQPIWFPWIQGWNFEKIDRRAQENNDVLSQLPTVIYALGTSQLDTFQSILRKMQDIMVHEHNAHYYIELLMYYFVKTMVQDESVITVPWNIVGWDATSQALMYY